MSATATQLFSSGEVCNLRYDTTPVKIASANVYFYTSNNSKMPNFELWYSCHKLATFNLCAEHGSSILLREPGTLLPVCAVYQKTTTDFWNAVSFPDFTYKILFRDGFGWNQIFWHLTVDSVSLMLRVGVSVQEKLFTTGRRTQNVISNN